MAVNWNRRKYTREEFVDAWQNSRSIAEVARRLNLTVYGSQYTNLKNAAEELGLTREHMPGQGWLSSDPAAAKRIGHKKRPPLQEVMIENSSYSRASLKKRLISEGLLVSKCGSCGITEWMGQPAPLALDHINGINNDHRLENLRLLCYNCHGQTATWCGKNKTL